MKKENGMGIISIILTIIVIILLIILGYHIIKRELKKEKVEDIKANMLILQGKSKILEESSKANNNEDGLKGIKVLDMKEDSIISEFLSKGLLEEDKLDKYYVISDEDLKSMELDIRNEKKSYYIVNYETNNVFITKGYKDVETGEIIYELKG